MHIVYSPVINAVNYFMFNHSLPSCCIDYEAYMLGITFNTLDDHDTKGIIFK